MRGEQLELELLAKEVRRRAGLTDDDFELATRIAARVLGPDAVSVDPELAGVAYLRQSRSGWQIVVNPNTRDVRFHVAHELGEWALRVLAKYQGDEVKRERAANYLAAAILAPEPSVREAYRVHGERVSSLAEHFQLSQTAIVLRLGEVVGDERAVVTKTGNVLVRTQGAFPWDAVPVVDIARGDAKWRGLVKARLQGGIDEGRVALRVR